MNESLQYDIDALRKNLEKCDKNIKIFEEAISKEIANKKRLRQMINTLEERNVGKK
jgi:hypothetical protein